jgi:hypothetical protein
MSETKFHTYTDFALQSGDETATYCNVDDKALLGNDLASEV